jgi:murein DD-endopeptidase MepM/ murein hydrolase activator NlpD
LTVALAADVWPAHFPTDERGSDNLCAAFGWPGSVETDLDFKEFFTESHTVAARFMIQYPRAYQAPILSVNGSGNYLVAVAGYGEGRVKAERLLVMIGGGTRYYTLAGKLAPERWHWLALVRDGARLRVYVDGALIKPDNNSSKEESAFLRDPPVGTLRLGRKASVEAQFYGLIDDVAIFNSALSQKTLKSYYDESPRLRGTEASLVAAYLFDDAPDMQTGARAARQRRVSFTAPATQIEVSSIRDSQQDAQRLPLPFNVTRVMLPFAQGTTWKVIQGYGQELSHNGGGCFALDLARVDGPTMEQPVYASASGRVVAVSDHNDPEPLDDISKDNFNYLQTETAPGEVITYLHMKNGSLTEALRRFAPASFPEKFVPFSVAAGAQVGRVGNTWLKEQPVNWHLHLAGAPFVNSPVSIPLALSDYEVYDAQGKTWRRVARGVPQQNQIVRRAN